MKKKIARYILSKHSTVPPRNFIQSSIVYLQYWNR